MKLRISYIPVGMVSANCYIVKDEDSGSAFVVDPGDYGLRLKSIIEKFGITELNYILLTHGHFDHIMGVSALKNDFGGKVVIHELDAECLYNSEKSLGDFFGASSSASEADITVRDNDELPFGNGTIKVIHTPGHTVGGVCYKVDNCLFTGDTLFAGEIGRTDFPGGSLATLLLSLKKLSQLDGNYRVYPGHDDLTDLETERKFNSYMKGM